MFVNHDGKWEAQPGYHDDFVMMLKGLLQVHITSPLLLGDIQQTDTADRPGQRPHGFVRASVAGGYDGWEDDDDIDPQEEVDGFVV